MAKQELGGKLVPWLLELMMEGPLTARGGIQGRIRLEQRPSAHPRLPPPLRIGKPLLQLLMLSKEGMLIPLWIQERICPGW